MGKFRGLLGGRAATLNRTLIASVWVRATYVISLPYKPSMVGRLQRGNTLFTPHGLTVHSSSQRMRVACGGLNRSIVRSRGLHQNDGAVSQQAQG